MSDQTALLTPVPTLRLGRKRTLHRYKLDIEDNRVIVRTRCGLDIDENEGFEETYAIPTCDGCEVAG